MLPGTSERSQRHTFLHVSFSDSFGLASVHSSHRVCRVRRYDTESTATIYLRLRDGRRLDSVAQTALSINPNLWDEKNECVKSKAVCDPKLRSETNEELRKLKGFIEKEYSRDKDNLDKDWLKAALVRYYNPDKFTPEGDRKSVV